MTDEPAVDPAVPTAPAAPAPVEYEGIELTAADERAAELAMTPGEKAKFATLSPEDKKSELTKRAHAARKMPHVSVGCSLSSGMSIVSKGKTYHLKGPDLAKKQKFGMTNVPEAAWDAWITEHEDFAPVVAGAIVGPWPKVAVKDEKKAPAA